MQNVQDNIKKQQEYEQSKYKNEGDVTIDFVDKNDMKQKDKNIEDVDYEEL